MFPELNCQQFPVWSSADSLRGVQRVSRGYSPQLFKRFLWNASANSWNKTTQRGLRPAQSIPEKTKKQNSAEPERWNSLHKFIGKQTIVAAILRPLCRKACSFGTTTRQSEIAVVRRLFKMGRKMVERRLKTVRRLLHPLLVEMCAMLENDDAYFPVLLFYYYFFLTARSAENVLV